MVDEFQDTNRLQLDVLEALERDNLFAVGDESQSIYGFRHADVRIFRERRAALGAAARARPLTANFRSREECSTWSTARSRPCSASGFTPLLAGARRRDRRAAAVRPRRAGRTEPRVELLVATPPAGRSDDRLGLAALDAAALAPRRGAAVAHAAARGARRGPAPRATSSCSCARRRRCGCSSRRSRSRACRPTSSAAADTGAQEQVRDGLAYLSALANPLDEEALLGVLASPFCGVGVRRAGAARRAGRAGGGGAWAALRGRGAAVARGAARRPSAERLVAFARFFAAERARAERLAGRGAARARDRRARATTSRSSREPAASGGWPTCAS